MQSALRKFVAPVVLTTGSLLLGGTMLLAQESNPEESPQEPVQQTVIPSPQKDAAPVHNLLNPNETTDQVPPVYTPITLKQKYEYSLEQMFSGPRLISILTHAAFDQFEVSPRQWGSNAPSFGIRTASLFGRSLLRATVASGIRGIDHEDPRYFYSHKKSNWERTKYAMTHTFEVHNDNGSMMPAYSRFIGDFGMPFLAQTWHPGGIKVADGFRSGGIALGMGIGMNIAQEFWPDLKHALHLGPGAVALVSPGTIH